MTETTAAELLALCQRLLHAIDNRDWSIYTELCDPTLTAFEPEAVGHLVAGMAFHDFYFQMERPPRPQQSSIMAPDVRLMDSAAVVAYVRLVQRIDDNGRSSTTAYEETRVWQRQNGQWKHVHFHRSRTAIVVL